VKWIDTGERVFPDFGWFEVRVLDIDPNRMLFEVIGGEHDGERVTANRVTSTLLEPGSRWWLRVDGDDATLFSPEQLDDDL
jgi:hypothetical protein